MSAAKIYEGVLRAVENCPDKDRFQSRLEHCREVPREIFRISRIAIRGCEICGRAQPHPR